MAVRQPTLITAEEFEAFLARPENQDRNFELIDGVIMEKAMPTDRHVVIAGLLIILLGAYAREHGLGIPGPERRIRLPGQMHHAVQPDVSMLLDPTIPIIERGPMQVMPDVIAEVKSHDDHYDDLRDKARYYIANGARLVWLFFPEKRIAEVYRPNAPSDILTFTDSLDGFEVLPGFSVPLAEVFTETRAG